jgi:type II secretion system protein I
MNAKGFTLVETLIALVIVAVSLGALVKANQQNVQQITYFKQKTLANLALSNLSVEKRLGQKPNIGYQSGEYILGKQTWYWSSHTQPTPNKNITKTDLTLYPTIAKRASKEVITELVLYLEK